MRSHKLIKPVTIVITFVIACTFASLTVAVWRSHAQHNINHSEARFTGTVTADECATPSLTIGDVGCSIKVDNATIQVMHGNILMDKPWGSLLGVSGVSENIVGRTVEVYAHEISTNNYDLAGSTDYYIKVVR